MVAHPVDVDAASDVKVFVYLDKSLVLRDAGVPAVVQARHSGAGEVDVSQKRQWLCVEGLDDFGLQTAHGVQAGKDLSR